MDLLAPHVPADRTVLFDEYSHGFRASSNFFTYLWRYRKEAFLIQVGVVLLVSAWAVAVRLGPAVPVPTGPKADAVDYAAAMARIYQKAGATEWLLGGLTRDFLAVVTSYLRLRRVATRQEVLAAWARRHPAAKDRLAELLAELDMLAGTREPPTRRLLHLARALDAFRHEFLEKPGRRRPAATKRQTVKVRT